MFEDKLLVLKCRSGNRDAMCRIYTKYKDHLLTLAKALTGEQAEAEDIVHDVFVSFARLAKQFHLTGSLKNYLATCVSNRARDKIRAKTRHNGAPAPANPVTPGSNNPEQNLIEKEEITLLRRAINQIPYEQREVVILHIKGGLKFKEIARLQSTSVSTIHGRYRYGLDKLRSLLNSKLEQCGSPELKRRIKK